MSGAAPRDLLLAVDQGTSSTKALLVDRSGGVVARASAPLGQAHPRPGWVEQDPDELWRSVRAAVAGCLGDGAGRRVAGIALSVQRESLVLWERASGRPVAPLVSWQDQRTAALVDSLRAAGHGPVVQRTSGLPLDSMFSAAKARWLLDAHDGDRARSLAGELCLGTVDSWLLHRLTGRHLTELGCASRTQLLDVRAGSWSPALLDVFAVPAAVLPEVLASDGPFGDAAGLHPDLDGAPVLAVLGDSHAALHARAGWRPGVVKATYGTGSSVMALLPGAGADPDAVAASGLCLTAAWAESGARGGAATIEPVLALEANTRSAGRTMTWLADLLGADVEDLWELAATTASDGVHLVPAFGGLGAPWWDGGAQALVSGLSLGSGRGQLARAALESVAFQVADVLAAAAGVGVAPAQLLADGGLVRSTALLQAQADAGGLPVLAAPSPELSALGAAHLAGRALGWWDRQQLTGAADASDAAARRWEPDPTSATATTAASGWRDALARSRGSGLWQG